MSLFCKAHDKLVGQASQKPQGGSLQLKLDHFMHAQPKAVMQEQVKLVATALRAEECLKHHLLFTCERQKMKAAIARSKKFTSGCEGIAEAENMLMEEALNEDNKVKKAFKPKITPLAADPKGGRGKQRSKALAENMKKDKEKPTASQQPQRSASEVNKKTIF